VNAREAIESADLDSFGELLAEDVVWIGLFPGEVCRNRGQVLDLLGRARDNGRVIAPEVVLERDDLLIVDPHLEDAERHQVFVVDHGRISEIRAYPDRAAAIAAVEERPW
jgi:ketosteroid isomerase-like protein